MNRSRRRALVAGVGDRWRGDHGAGSVTIAELRGATDLADLVDITPPIDPLTTAWADRPLVVVITTTTSDAPPGRIRRVEITPGCDVDGDEDPGLGGFDPGLVETCRRGAADEHGPRRLVLIGVEGGPSYDGLGLSLLVADAVPELVARARAEVAAFASLDTPPDPAPAPAPS